MKTMLFIIITKTGLSVAFILFAISIVHSQDSSKVEKVLYKIPSSKLGTDKSACKPKLSQSESKSVLSCAVDGVVQEAIVSIKLSNGTVTKEKYIVKEIK